MELKEDQKFEKYVKQCGNCMRNILLPYKYFWVCISCRYFGIKWKSELTRNQRKKIFIIWLKYAEFKIFCICIDGIKIDQSNDSKNIFKVLSDIKNKNLKFNIMLIEKSKNMLIYPDFEQTFYWITGKGFYRIGQDGIRIRKVMA